MHLESARRVENGRCAVVSETLQRLESALQNEYAIHYRETRVGEALYRGALDVDALDFAPMGKGTSSDACKAATLAEAAEWLALTQIPFGPAEGPLLPLEDLVPHVATVTPESLARIRELDVMQRHVQGYSLIHHEPVSVPLGYVHYIGGTNGVAAGNIREEAIVQGINEIFERRAVITVIKNRLVVPTIDPETILHPVLEQQMNTLTEAGVRWVIKDLSFGGALPCVGVYFRRPDVPETLQSHHVFKAAAHEDRFQALMGCFSEYAQVASPGAGGNLQPHETMRTGDGTDNFLSLFWFGYVPWTRADFLLEGDMVPFDPGNAFDDCLQDIDASRVICRELGRDMVALDLTDPRIGFSVVQVVIPGYSDILPYHPASSPVLFEGWTRSLPLGYTQQANGDLEPCTANGLFPDW